LQPGTGDGDRIPTSAHAARYHLDAGGQRIRLRLAFDAGLALGMTTDDAICIASAVELLHNASLVHDDLQDRDDVRRGQPSLWSAFGDDIAICSGDLMLSAAYGALATYSCPEHLPQFIALIHARTAQAIAGQCADLEARSRPVNNVDAYKRIAIDKSGALLGLPLELALVASSHGTALATARHAADAFAVGYQIFDDIDDFAKDAPTGHTGGAARPDSLNILSVLTAAGYGTNARQVAFDIGLGQLHTAAAAAADLPNRSGDLLRDLALRLAARL
jgi:geranylgeranyl pyrophosphate synthase